MSLETIIIYSPVFILILYVMICAGYLVFHRYFIIFPSRKLTALPSDLNLKYDDVYFTTVDKVLLNGWLINGVPEGKWKEYTILLFSGNKGAMSDFLPQMTQMTKVGFNVFLFSYRGFGKSRKKWPTEEGVYRDSEAACNFLTAEREIPLKKIIFMGQSLGCAMASYTAQNHNPFALMLEGGFPSLVKVASRAVKWLPLKLLTRSRFETSTFLKNIRCPALVIHSNEDRAIPLSDAEDLFKAVTVKKKKVLISGPHAKGLESDSKNYIQAMDRFLNEILHEGDDSADSQR